MTSDVEPATASADIVLTTMGVCSISASGNVLSGVPSSFYRTAVYLLLSGTNNSVSRNKLSDLLWPDIDHEHANTNLRQGLARIRRFQETHQFRLIESNFTLVFLTSTNIDWDLRRILDLLDGDDEDSITELCRVYSGELLADIGGSGSGFEDWLADQRDELRNQFIETVVAAIRNPVRMSEASRGYCARRLLAVDPTNEPAFQVLRVEAAAHGDYARLHNLFERCERLLMNELGVRSSPDTRGLYVQLTQGIAPQ